MKPFWKNSRKKKTKKPTTPLQQKPRTRAKPKSMEEPWKPPMAVPPKAMGQERTPITQMLESARPARNEYIPARPSTRKSEYYHEFRSNFQQLLSPKCRPIDIWRDFIVMVACAMSNTVDKASALQAAGGEGEGNAFFLKAALDVMGERFLAVQEIVFPAPGPYGKAQGRVLEP